MQLHTRSADPLCCEPRPRRLHFQYFVPTCNCKQARPRRSYMSHRCASRGAEPGVFPPYSKFSAKFFGQVDLSSLGRSFCGICCMTAYNTGAVCLSPVRTGRAQNRGQMVSRFLAARCKVVQLLPLRGVHVQRDCPRNGCVARRVNTAVSECGSSFIHGRCFMGATDSRCSCRAAGHCAAGGGASSCTYNAVVHKVSGGEH